MGEFRDADDWGYRAVWWLKQRFVNWPVKAVARSLNETESVVVSWWSGDALPSRKKLQKLIGMFGREGLSSFVFGEPCREEMRARLDALNAHLIELREMIREKERLDQPRHLVDSRKAGSGCG